MPLGVLFVGVCLGGCGDEKIPLKKVDSLVVFPENKGDELPKNLRANKGTTAGIKRDPSGMHPGQ